jgi:hypothetical protein
MSELRIALYVYKDSKVDFEPVGPIELYGMADDYSAKYIATIDAPKTLELQPGVYGFFYADKHGVTAPGGTVTVVEDVERKKPWPLPPPPPPPPFAIRRDWPDHQAKFMVPLGAELVDQPADDDRPRAG